MIYVISGPSCVGKSTLIESNQLTSFSNIATTTPIVLASNIRNRFNEPRDNFFLHYNIMRPASAAYENKVPDVNSSYSFTSDKPWRLISRRSVDKSAIVLVTSRSVLIRRMKSRVIIEKSMQNCSRQTYPNSYWLSILERIDLYKLYTEWISELKRNGITYKLIKSSEPEYEEINDEQFHSLCINA